MYTAQDAEEWLRENNIQFFRTGSRVVCDPPVMDTDADIVAYDPVGKLNMRSWMEATTDDEYDGAVRTFRKGEVNLIVAGEADDFKRWQIATRIAKSLNLTDKTQRIALFQGVLYDNWSMF